MNNIYLVGFMGTGKTTVGKAISVKTGRVFKDLDDLIEERENKKISEIFLENTEEYFRKVESEVIADIGKKNDLIIATGGGAVINPLNYHNLKKSGILVTLAASPESIYERVTNSAHRPLLNVSNPLEEIKRLMFERAYYYIKSDYIIDTTDRSIDETVEQILELIK